MLEYLFFLRGVFVILKGDLPFFLNGVMDLIHAVIDALILRFGGTFHINMPIQLAGMRFTGELTQLFNKPLALFGRNKAGGFYRVHQQLQLRQFKQPLPHEVSILGAFDAYDVHTAALQDFNSGIYALAPRLNATLLPEGKNIRHRGRMLVIRMLIQIPL